eukprot:COSAG01_NODE_77186_length_169_cov_29.914286_1_plen_34_part_10
MTPPPLASTAAATQYGNADHWTDTRMSKSCSHSY